MGGDQQRGLGEPLLTIDLDKTHSWSPTGEKESPIMKTRSRGNRGVTLAQSLGDNSMGVRA